MGLIGFNDHHKLRNIIPVAIFLLYLIPNRKTFYWIVLPLSIAAAFFTPISLLYGNIDYQAMISVLATNTQEADEFLRQIPTKYFLQSLCVPFIACISFWLSQKLNIRPWRNKLGVLASVFILIIAVKPTNIIDNISSTYVTTKEDLQALKQYVNNASWTDVAKSTANKDYVLIIGESARRDYFHLYGYPIPNTPFLENVPGATVVEGMTSAAHYTVGSLTNMLTVGEKANLKPRYDYNLIDLANLAGIRTHWISNQGYIGKHDTPVAAIANRAQDVFFFNKQSYEKTNISDFFLLSPFTERLANPASGPRLFVLHTMGSHPDVCKRVTDVKDPLKVRKQYYKQIACYVDSIRKTDAFIARTYKILLEQSLKNNRPFSIIYFSDHGLCHKVTEDKLLINNNELSHYHHDIPLIRIDSDQQERNYVKNLKFGFNFTEGLAHWMGIRSSALADQDLFDGKDDLNDLGFYERVRSRKPHMDPAVDLLPYLDN